jgi:hypothetical protein
MRVQAIVVLWHNMGVRRRLIRVTGMLGVGRVLELIGVLPLHVAEGVHHPGSWSFSHAGSVKSATS